MPIIKIQVDSKGLLPAYETHTGQIRDDSIVTKTKKVDSYYDFNPSEATFGTRDRIQNGDEQLSPPFGI